MYNNQQVLHEEYTSLDKALKEPDKVYKLKLTRKRQTLPASIAQLYGSPINVMFYN